MKGDTGLKIRKSIDGIFSTIHPYILILIPNFKIAHYVYIIFWVIVSSIFLYPVHNGSYIDMLFFATGASTQSGLNTIDVNNLDLWQQMVLYIVPMLTTPIFIHGTLLFIRLYGFERYFDGIKESLKLNNKMRKSMSIANTMTNATGNSNRNNNQFASWRNASGDTQLNTANNQVLGIPLVNINHHNDEPQQYDPQQNDRQPNTTTMDSSDVVDHISDPSSTSSTPITSSHKVTESPNHKSPPDQSTASTGSSQLADDDQNNNDEKNIRFQLPKRQDPSASDMFRSIGLLQSNRARNKATPSDENASSLNHNNDNNTPIDDHIDDDDDDDGEVLVIKRPDQIENDEGPIYTKVQFNEPKRKLHKVTSRLKKLRTMSMGSDDSIDSENDADIDHRNQNLHPSRNLHQRDDDEEESMFTSISNTLSRTKTVNYLSWEPTIGRNSNFVHLTDEQKQELGGVEYRAIKLLIKIVWIYYIGFHILALLVYLIWILYRPQHIEQLRSYGLNPSWWGVFTGASHFNDLGYTLTPNSMIDYNESLYPMIWGAIFIVIGNTGFPVVLRLIIWLMNRFAEPLSLYQESLQFLLDHPRRCFTLLFPSGPSWWLLAVLIILNGIDLIFFIILDLNNSYLLEIPTGYRIMCGLYTAVSTRTAGLTVVDISQLHYAVQVGYIIMMYISVLPIAISIRRTNVYEEQSLGIYVKDKESEDEKSPKTFISNHLRNQLSFDLWFVFLALFLICIAENGKLEKDNIRFTPFTILFEVVSAYGTVGLSQGYEGSNTSFSGQFSTVSKLIMIAVMIRGRHRGLPYSLDRAIMLPNDDMQRRDRVQEHHELRRQETIDRQNSIANNGGTTGMGTGIGAGLFKAISRGGEQFRRRRSTFARSRTGSGLTASGLTRPFTFNSQSERSPSHGEGPSSFENNQLPNDSDGGHIRRKLFRPESLSDLTPNEEAVSINSN